MNRFETMALSHNDIAFAFIFFLTVVISVTPLSNKSAAKALLKYPLSLIDYPGIPPSNV